MLKDSLSHAKEDVEARKLREEQVEADRVVEALSAALQEDGDQLLSVEEKQTIETAINELRQIASTEDQRAIRRMIETFDKLTEDYSQRRMDASINKALAGHRVDEIIK